MFLKIKMFTSVFGISNESKPLFGDSFIFFVLIYDRQLKVKWAHQKKCTFISTLQWKHTSICTKESNANENKMKKNCMNISMWLCKHLELNRLEKQSKWEWSSNFNNFLFQCVKCVVSTHRCLIYRKTKLMIANLFATVELLLLIE